MQAEMHYSHFPIIEDDEKIAEELKKMRGGG